MNESGSGLLEISITDIKLDKTIMEKQLTVVVEVDNREIANLVINRAGRKLKTQIDSANEIMELKICAGKSGRDADHIGMFLIIVV